VESAVNGLGVIEQRDKLPEAGSLLLLDADLAESAANCAPLIDPVVSGEADLAVQAEHEIRCVRGATFLPYPVAFQRTTRFIGSVGAAAGDVAAAKDYLAFITGPETATAITAHCLTRG